MFRLNPDEHLVEAGMKFVDGRCEGDDAWKRIAWLLSTQLRKVAGGGWETLYLDPADDRLWELDYPQSAMHGGGPPRLRHLTAEEAPTRYGYETGTGDEPDADS